MSKNIPVENIKQFLNGLGWAEDRYGNLKKTGKVKTAAGKVEDREYRIKFQTISIRIESSYRSDYDNKIVWVKIGGRYLKNAKMSDDGALVLGSMVFRRK